METQKFEQWALVELFGHARMSGKVTEEIIGGTSFVRIDVPAFDDLQPITKYYGQGAIYSMTIVDQETAIASAMALRVQPVSIWSARSMLQIEEVKMTDTEQDPVERFEDETGDSEGYDPDVELQEDEEIPF